MTVYSFDSYRDYLKSWIDSNPDGSRGQLLKMAKAAGIHPSVLSQVFQGHRNLTAEQAVSLCDYLELNENETRFFHLLVQFERAGTPKLRELLKAQINEVRKEETQLSRRVSASKALSEDQKAVFYSHWLYSGTRVLSSIPKYQSLEVLRRHLGLSREMFASVVEFLLMHRLVVESKSGIEPIMQNTHIGGNSPLAARHHGNWRVKAMERHPQLASDKELAFTSPMSLSHADVTKVRAILADAIEEVCRVTDPSKPEAAYCLNVDWFAF